MICYRDKTFCSGGAPRCASFASCPKALTDDVKARAQAVGLYIASYVAPEAMPCYSRTAKAQAMTKTGRKITFSSLGLAEAEWRAHFEQAPRRSDQELAEVIGCTITTIRNNRVRLGYPPAKPSGVTRWTLYDEADALRLIKAVRPDDKHLLQASRRLGLPDNTAKHLRDRFRETFKRHGL